MDVVSITGLSVAGMAFGVVCARSDGMENRPNEGLIGMTFGSIAQSRGSTFFESLIAQRKVPAPLFSVHLSGQALPYVFKIISLRACSGTNLQVINRCALVVSIRVAPLVP